MNVIVMPQRILKCDQSCSTLGKEGGIHDNWNEDGRPQSLQQDIGEGLENGVRDEENRERRIISARRHVMKALLQTIDFRISDIRSVEESEEIEDTELLRQRNAEMRGIDY
jgi:pyruvate-formate lyase